ncbi:MAG: HlyD family efflux transporter periplasmic adaptor subunit [Planctomycetaceae bacterium]
MSSTGAPSPNLPVTSRRKWAKMSLTLLLVPAILFVAVSGFLTLANLKEEPVREAPTQRLLRISVFDVAPVDFTPFLSAFGSAQAEQEVMISSEVSGRVVEVPNIKVGSRVRGPATVESAAGTQIQPGDTLVRIDPETYNERILQAESLIAQAAVELERVELQERNNRRLLLQKQQSLDSVKTQLDTARKLFEQGAGRESDLRRAELEYQQVEAAVLQLTIDIGGADIARKTVIARRETQERELALVQLDMKRTLISAPFSGRVSELMVEQGQYVRPGESLVRLTNLKRVEVPLAIPIGQSQEISKFVLAGTFPAVELAENETAAPRWTGRITRIAPVADPTTRTVNLFAEVDNDGSPDPLLPGTFVHARIRTSLRTDVLLIPRAAILDGTVFVVVADSTGETVAAADRDITAIDKAETVPDSPSKHLGVTARRRVKLGQTYRGLVEVVDGLQPGDRVILTNLDVLEEGASIEVIAHQTVESEIARDRIPVIELQSMPELPQTGIQD